MAASQLWQQFSAVVAGAGGQQERAGTLALHMVRAPWALVRTSGIGSSCLCGLFVDGAGPDASNPVWVRPNGAVHNT
jgi:hypothetical protein